jgi:hypothetical protein
MAWQNKAHRQNFDKLRKQAKEIWSQGTIHSKNKITLQLLAVGGVVCVLSSSRTLASCAHVHQPSTTILLQPNMVQINNNSAIKNYLVNTTKTVQKIVRTMLRLLSYLFTLSPALISAPVAMLMAKRNQETGEIDNLEWWWKILTDSVEKSGPALLKFFQV